MTKNQIVEWKVCLPPIEVDHNIISYQSHLEMIGRNENTTSLEDHEIFLGEKFYRDLAFADWRPMYQEENCDEIFTKFNEIFQSILDQHAPIQNQGVNNIKTQILLAVNVYKIYMKSMRSLEPMFRKA